MEEEKNNHTTVIVNQTQTQGNGSAVAGFTLSLLATFLGWIPFVGFILWLLGAIFSCVGMSRKPRGLAIAGFVISFFWIILLATIFTSVLAAVGMAEMGSTIIKICIVILIILIGLAYKRAKKV